MEATVERESDCPRELMALAEHLARSTSLTIDESRRGIAAAFAVVGTSEEVHTLAREFESCAHVRT